MTTRFISDLHLEEARPDITDAFLSFLKDKAMGIDALYILGDFFEAWIGDDEKTPLQNQVAEALRAVSHSGTSVYLMHGNRDFLIGEDYCGRCGATLLPDPTVVDLYGTPTLLMRRQPVHSRCGVPEIPRHHAQPAVATDVPAAPPGGPPDRGPPAS